MGYSQLIQTYPLLSITIAKYTLFSLSRMKYLAMILLALMKSKLLKCSHIASLSQFHLLKKNFRHRYCFAKIVNLLIFL